MAPALVLVACLASPAVDAGELTRLLDASLARDKALPGRLADDHEFCRRVHLDLIGRIPTPGEIGRFLAEPTETRRTRLVARLAGSPAFADAMAGTLHLLLMERLGDNQAWLAYLKAFAGSDRAIRSLPGEILDPGAKGAPPGAGYFLSRRLENYGQNPVDYPALTRDVGRLFLGMDLRCAQCHDHLTVQAYKQAHYQGLYAFTRQMVLTDAARAAVAEKPVAGKVSFSSVFDMERLETGPALPGRKPLDVPEVRSGEEYAVKPDRKTNSPGVPRVPMMPLLAEAVSGDERLARTLANRLVRVYLGRGIVEPPDFDHPGNPPVLPATMETLAKAIRDGASLRVWVQGVVNSRLYQACSGPPAASGAAGYTSAIERPLPGEVLAACVETALGDGKPDDARLKRFRQVFGHPPREPDEGGHPSVEKALFWRNEPLVRSMLVPAGGNLMDRLSRLRGREFADALFLAILCRQPSAEEREAVLKAVSAASDHAEGMRIAAWALMATTEFQVNH